MQIENEFTVPAPADRLWAYLLDVEQIAPCLPGAELTETVDDSTWKGKVNMKLGPVSLSFAGTVTIAERDDEQHRVVLRAKGMEQKGKGAANASVTSWLEPGDGQTLVKMTADIQLTGAVAQLSRGLLPEVSKKLTAQFAECLEANMLAARSPEPTAASLGGTAETRTAGERPVIPGTAPATAKPISGIRLGLSAIWAAIRRFFARLFGSRTS
ncbi:MAG: SRPBCC family protein [Actinomycetota bacterium]